MLSFFSKNQYIVFGFIRYCRLNPDKKKRGWKEKFLNAIAEKPRNTVVLLRFLSLAFKNFLSLQNCFAPETA